jgi:beta-xylosidase
VTPALASSKDPHFDYENPIPTEPIRDPQIVKVGKTWYMTGTASPFVEGTSQGPVPGVKLWSSTNLTQWKFVSLLITPSKDHWYMEGFEAPELFPYKGKWYLTFSCRKDDVPNSPMAVVLAVSNKIGGPYVVLTEDKPLTEGSDATLFQNDDGKVYLFRNGISAIQVDLESATTVGEPFTVIQPGPGSDWDGTAPGAPSVGLEGPTVFKHDHNYYLLYASLGRGYEEGYATAPRITGPWLKYHNNPVYGGQDEEWSKIYKHEYKQASDVPYGALANGSPFIGPDGELWFGCHGSLKGAGAQPHLVITPITFDHQVIHMTMTWTPQVIFLPHHFHVHLGDTRLASPDLTKLAVQP